jgi:hypothetical protein
MLQKKINIIRLFTIKKKLDGNAKYKIQTKKK